MARLKLSKASLQQERTKLRLYEKLLPSLELKRRQLTIELDKARKQYERARFSGGGNTRIDEKHPGGSKGLYRSKQAASR